MYEYMSMLLNPAVPTACPPRPCNRYRQLLGIAVRCRREQLGLSLDQAAYRAGVEAFMWFGLEEGAWVPEDTATLRSIADSLEASYIQVSFLALVSRHNR
jgi:hypothetical protein